MAHYTSKVMGFALDSSTGVLTDISGSVNSQAINSAITILDDTGMGDTHHTTLAGLVSAESIPLNGFLNSTVEGIIGPLLVGGTSITKTVEFKAGGSKYYTGEMYPQDVSVSGSVDTVETWSMTLVAENGLTRTSVGVAL